MSIQRGEIYYVDLGPAQSKEQAFRRPVLVLSVAPIQDNVGIAIVVPGTSGKWLSRTDSFAAQFTTRVSAAESGLGKDGVYLCFQVRALDTSKFPNAPAGRIAESALRRIEEAVQVCLGMRA